MQDLGKVIQKSWGASFWFCIDHEGNCWFTEWRKGGIFPEGGQGSLFRVVADVGFATLPAFSRPTADK